MTTQQNNVDRGPAAGGPFQFSLRAMFAVTSILAVAFSLLLAAPGLVRVIAAGCLIVALPVVLTVVLIHGRGYARTFSIGALFPATLASWCAAGPSYSMLFLWEAAAGNIELGFGPAIVTAGTFSLSIATGLLAVLVRWLLERHQRRQHQEASSPHAGSQHPDTSPPTSPGP